MSLRFLDLILAILVVLAIERWIEVGHPGALVGVLVAAATYEFFIGDRP
jgi:hypothetical protein